MLGLNAAAIKLLAIGTLLALTSGCASHSISTADNYQKPKTLFGLAANIGKYHWYALDSEQYSRHQACVVTSLHYSAFGDKCDWSSGGTRGMVQVADVYLAGSRVCKVLRTSIRDKKGKTYTNTQRACGSGDNWKFIES